MYFDQRRQLTAVLVILLSLHTAAAATPKPTCEPYLTNYGALKLYERNHLADTISPDGTLVATLFKRDEASPVEVRIYDVKTQDPVTTIPVDSRKLGYYPKLFLAPNNQFVVIEGKNQVLVYDIASKRKLHAFKINGKNVHIQEIEISANSKYVTTVSRSEKPEPMIDFRPPNRRIREFNPGELRLWEIRPDRVEMKAWDPRRLFVAFSDRPKRIQILPDLTILGRNKRLPGIEPPFWSNPSLSSTGDILVETRDGDERLIRVKNLASGEVRLLGSEIYSEIDQKNSKKDGIRFFRFTGTGLSEDGRYLGVAGYFKTYAYEKNKGIPELRSEIHAFVDLWDTFHGKLLSRIEGISEMPDAARLTIDGQRLVVELARGRGDGSFGYLVFTINRQWN